ncbi:ABC transporter substrate-binding protein [Lapidilactobacillus salsurivasis]
MKQRKFFSALLVGILGATLLSACGGSPSSKDAGNDSAKNEELSIMLSGSESDAFVDGYRKMIDKFNKINEYGVTVKPEFLSSSDYKTKLTTMMASDSESDIIFTYELGYLENFVNGGKIVNLQKYLDKDKEWADSFNDGTIEQLTYDGDAYGIPTAQSIAVMYYNKAIFDKYGLTIPNTYDEYLKICETLKNNGVTPVALASTADDAWLVSQYIQQLSNGIAGNKLFENLKAGSGKWNDKAMVQAGELFQKEVSKGYYEDGFTGVGATEAEALFQTGQTAMYFNGTWEVANLDNPDICEVAADVRSFTMPPVTKKNADVSVGSLDNSFAITKNCKNVDAAVAFLKFWCNEDNATKLLYDYGKMPSTSVTVDKSKISALSKEILARFDEQKALTPWFDRMDTDLGNEFNNSSIAIANGDNPQKIFDKLQEYAASK